MKSENSKYNNLTPAYPFGYSKKVAATRTNGRSSVATRSLSSCATSSSDSSCLHISAIACALLAPMETRSKK